jgi:hypothetical protein
MRWLLGVGGGPLLEQEDTGGFSALMNAAWRGDEAVIRLLTTHPDCSVAIVEKMGHSRWVRGRGVRRGP